MSDDDFPRELSETDAAMAGIDEMLAGLHDLTETNETNGDADNGEGEEGGSADETPVHVDDPADPVPPGYLRFEGRDLPIDEVRGLLAFSERLKAEPDTAQRVATAVTAPTQTQLPDWIDPEDTATVKMYEHTEAIRAENSRLNAQVTQSAERDQRARVVDSFKSAVTAFKTEHPGLTDAQVAQIADATGRANIIEGLERSEGSLTAAFSKGMEMTMWGTPSLRSLALSDNDAKVTDNKSADRKKKASALSSSGGSAPRNSPTRTAPKTRDELMEAMLADVRNDPSLTGA